MGAQLCWDRHGADPSLALHRHPLPIRQVPRCLAQQDGALWVQLPKEQSSGQPKAAGSRLCSSQAGGEGQTTAPSMLFSSVLRKGTGAHWDVQCRTSPARGNNLVQAFGMWGKSCLHHSAGRWHTAALGSLLTPATVGVSMGACTHDAALLGCSGAQQGCRSPPSS